VRRRMGAKTPAGEGTGSASGEAARGATGLVGPLGYGGDYRAVKAFLATSLGARLVGPRLAELRRAFARAEFVRLSQPDRGEDE